MPLDSTYRELTYPDGKLMVAATAPRTRVHGPGTRFSLWLQGCLKRCTGCINPQMLAETSPNAILTTPEELLRQIRQARDSVAQVKGLTLHGGEPTLQARNLAPVLEQLRAETPQMNILMFTGYDLEELRALNNEAVNRLLATVDTVIDNPFEITLFDPLLVRGSTNQKIHHLTDALQGADFSRHWAERILAPDREIQTGVSLTTAQ